MTRNKTYKAKVGLEKNTAEVDVAYFNCKAGADGYCKHVGPVLFTILDFVENGFEEIPPNKSCTENPRSSTNHEHKSPRINAFVSVTF